MPIGSIIQGIAGPNAAVTGAYLDYRGVKKTNEANFRLRDQDIELQKEFAKHGISWKVQDAKRAGIHPLAALGSNTMSYTPVPVGIARPNWAAHGQNLSRAISNITASRAIKDSILDTRIKKAQAERIELENKGLKQTIDGQTESVVDTPVKVPMRDKITGEQAGNQPGYTKFSDDRGRVSGTTTEQSSQMIGDEAPMQVSVPRTLRGISDWGSDIWSMYQNKIDPRHYRDPKFKSLVRWARNYRTSLPKPRPGYEWRYHVGYRDWTQKRIVNGRSKLFIHNLPFDVH